MPHALVRSAILTAFILAASSSVGMAQEATAAPPLQPADSSASAPPRNVLAWPIYVRWTTDAGNALRVYGPVTSTWRSEAVRSTYLVFPLTGARRLASGARETDLLWPFVDYRTDPAAGSTRLRVAGPLLAYERQRSEVESRLRVTPIYTRERTVTGRRIFEVTPFVHLADDPKAQRRVKEFGFAPYLGGAGLSLYRAWSEGDEWGWNAALLFGGVERPESRALWAIPYIAYDRRSGPQSPASFRTLGGLYTSWRSPESQWWNAALLYGAGSSPQGRWRNLPPYFSNTRPREGGDSTSVRTLIPIYGELRDAQREVTVALPSYWSYRSPTLRSHGLWPFYSLYRRSEADSVTRGGGSVAWPVVTWGRGENFSTLGILPFFYRLEDGPTRIALAPPFYGDYRTPTLNVRAIVPVYLRRWREADSLDVYVLYYRRTAVDRQYRGLLPIWASWYTASSERRTQVYGPLILTRGAESRGFGLLPVYYREAGPAGTAALLGPVFWSRGRDGSRRTAVIPLGLYARDSAGTDLHLLPLSGYRSRVNGQRFTYVLWPLYTRQSDGAEMRRTTLLLWLARDDVRGTRRRAWFQPFVYYDRPSEESAYVAVLGGLLSSYERKGAEKTLRVLLIPVRRWRSPTSANRHLTVPSRI